MDTSVVMYCDTTGYWIHKASDHCTIFYHGHPWCVAWDWEQAMYRFWQAWQFGH